MKVYCFCNQKGGAGKSTLCASVAVASGDSLILDTDPQGSVSAWFQARPHKYKVPECARCKPEDVFRIRRLSSSPLIFVDTAGDLTAGKAIDPADVCVIPVRPSIHDLRAAAATVELCAGKRTVFVLSACPPRRLITEHPLVNEAKQALLAFGLPIAPVAIRQRSAYAHSAVAGLGVTEWTDAKAAREIRELWTWLEDL